MLVRAYCLRNKRVLLLGLLAAFLVLIMLNHCNADIHVALGQTDSVTTGCKESEQHCITLVVPAVSGKEGTLVHVRVCLAPGTGVIHFLGPEKVGIDTKASAWTAFFVSAMLSGSDPGGYNVKIKFEDATPAIRGPSASLAMALALYDLLEKRDPKMLENSSITGAIGLDGLAVIVGGLKEKAEATRNAGLAFMFCPLSNFELISLRRTSGNQSFRLVPVTGLLELATAIEGGDFRWFGSRMSLPKEFNDYMRACWDHFYNLTKSIMITEDINSNGITALLNESLVEAQKGNFYSAASLAYTAYMRVLEKKVEKQCSSDPEAIQHLTRELRSKLDSLRNTLRSIEDKMLKSGNINLPSLECLATAEARAWMSGFLLEKASKAHGRDEAMNLLADALARYESALLWVNASRINWCYNEPVNLYVLARALDEYNRFLNWSLVYTRALIEEANMSSIVKDYLDSLEDLAAKINAKTNSNNTVLKYGLACELASRIAFFLSQLSLVDEKTGEKYVESAEAHLMVLYTEAVTRGLSPIIPLAYLQYSNYNGLDYSTKLYMLDSAISYVYPLLLYGIEKSKETLSTGMFQEKVSVTPETSRTPESIRWYTIWVTISFLVSVGALVGAIAASTRCRD